MCSAGFLQGVCRVGPMSGRGGEDARQKSEIDKRKLTERDDKMVRLNLKVKQLPDDSEKVVSQPVMFMAQYDEASYFWCKMPKFEKYHSKR